MKKCLLCMTLAAMAFAGSDAYAAETGSSGYATYQVTPTYNSTIASFSDFLLEFNFGDNVKSVGLSDSAEDENVSATWNGENYAAPMSSYRGNPLMFSYRSGMPQGTGVFTLHIDANTLKVTYTDGTVLYNDVIDYKLNVGTTDVTYNITPANGTTVESIYRLQFEWPDATAVQPRNPSALGSMTFNGENYDIDGYKAVDNKIDLNFVEITEKGEVKWNVPADLYKLTMKDGSEKGSPAMNGSFFVAGLPEIKNNLIWEFDPADESTAVAPSSIKVTFPQATAINNARADYITVYFGEDYDELDFTMGAVSGNTAVINLSKPIDNDGEVTVVFNPEAFTLTLTDGTKVYSPDYAYSFTAEKNNEVAYTVSPADGASVESIYQLFFTFENAVKVDVINAGSFGAMTFNGAPYDIDNASWQANRNRLAFTFVEITEKGTLNWTVQPDTYKITFADGSVKNNSLMSGSVNVLGTPEVKENLTWEFDPADSSTAIAPASVTVTFPEAATVDQVDADYIMVMFGEDYEDVEFTLGEIKGNSFVINFNEPINKDGEVTVVFNPEAVKMTLTDGTVVFSNDYAYSFTAEQKIEQNYTVVSPVAGTYEQYPDVVIRYDNCTAVNIKEGARAMLYVGTIAETNANKAALDIVAGENEGEVKFVPVEPIELFVSAYSVYNLVVPADSYSLTISGKTVENTELKITDFKVSNPAERLAKCTIDPAPGSINKSALASMTVNVVSELISLNALYKVTLNKVNADGTVSKVGNMTTGSIADDKMSFTMSYTDYESLEDGEYRISFPKEAYYVKVNGVRTGSPVQSFDYTITFGTGVEITDAADSFDIYTMTGVCLGRGVDAEAVRALAKGLYIINGKKTVIR